jgi:hypothetical protein
MVAGGVAQPEVFFRGRAELGERSGRVRRNAHHAARRLEPAEAAALVEAAERIAVNERPPLLSEQCGTRRTRAPSCVRARS